MKHRIFSFAIFFCLLAGEGYGQCDKCDGKTDTVFVIDPKDAETYIRNFDSFYRRTARDPQRHSISAEFSRQAFLEFYQKNFVQTTDKYSGMNIYPVLDDRPRGSGHEANNQMGMILAPRDKNCKVDTSGFICGNNSFDGQLGSAARMPVRYTGDELDKYCVKYRKEFKHGIMWWNLLYTRTIFLDKRVCDFIFKYFNDTPSADGFAIFPASYGEKKKKICGQKRKKQMTIVIIAIVNGKVDSSAFKTYLDKQTDKDKSFMTLNHGSLCPSKCY